MTRREKIAFGVLCVLYGAEADSWRHDKPWRGALAGLAVWLGVLRLDADPELKELAR